MLRFCLTLCRLHLKYSFSSAMCCSKVCLFPVNRIKMCNQTCESLYWCIRERNVQANWLLKNKAVKRE